MNRNFNVLTVLLLLGLSLTLNSQAQDVPRPENWQEESHSKSAEPNYDIVFPQDRINTLTITISPENWQAMQVSHLLLQQMELAFHLLHQTAHSPQKVALQISVVVKIRCG